MAGIEASGHFPVSINRRGTESRPCHGGAKVAKASIREPRVKQQVIILKPLTPPPRPADKRDLG